MNKKPHNNNNNKTRFIVGDYVLIPKNRKTFQKAYDVGWSREVFKIRRIRQTSPVTYNLEDLQNEPISGVFYEQELQKTKLPDTYEIESILSKKGDKYLVKWKHYPKKFNQWVHTKDLHNI